MLIDPTVRVDPFHTPAGTAFSDLTIHGHRETWPIRWVRFRSSLRRQASQRPPGKPRAACLNSALNLLEAQAKFDGPECLSENILNPVSRF
jgi:hypothetical protein